MKKILTFVVALTAVGSVEAEAQAVEQMKCGFRSLIGADCTWRGFLYPDKNFLINHIDIGEFSSLPRCRTAVMEEINRRSLRRSAIDYECGLNCKISRYGTGYTCDRTAKDEDYIENKLESFREH
tara:strand:- start:203 stop:577 length:375 start_codon:yes stop_codon:yes gene_type:complete